MKTKDVTEVVEFELNDGECLPLTKCVCGCTYSPWDLILDMGVARTMPCCGRRLYFSTSIQVSEVLDSTEAAK